VPVVSLKETLDRAFAERYGVPAINIINDLTIDAVLAAAVEENSPVILQTSVKTVVMYGRHQLYGIFRGHRPRLSGAGHPAPGPLPAALGRHRLPGWRLELGAVRCA